MTLLSESLSESLSTDTPIAESRDRGKKVGKFYRLQWSDAEWEIEELPQKGGPRKVRHATMQNPLYPSLNGTREGDNFIPANILSKAGLDANDTYDQVKDKLFNASKAALEKVQENPKLSWVRLPQWYERSRGAVMVTPEGADKIEVKAKDFTINCSYDKFSAFSPGSTMHYAPDGDPHYTEIHQTSAGAARKLYNAVKKDPTMFANVTWSDFTDALRKAGIGYDYSFSQWS